MLLVGYIEKHKESCLEEYCPLKARKSGKNKSKNQSEMEELLRGLIQEINKIFVNGLNKY